MRSTSLSRVNSDSASRRAGKKGHRSGAKSGLDKRPAVHAELPAALYRIDEAAGILNVKPKTLRNRISLGEIAIFRVGRGVRISKETLQEILARGYVPARGEHAS
jgi:excisionase family DNA binding protein